MLAQRQVYKYMLFVHDDTVVDYGGLLQEKACEYLRIPATVAMEFWVTYGKRQLKLALRLKRQTITTSIRNKFRGKYIISGLYEFWYT